MAVRLPGTDRDRPTSSLDDVVDAARALVDVMRTNGLTELDVSAGDVSIRLRAPKSAAGARTLPSSEPVQESAPAAVEAAVGHVVTAPMIGTFYASPAAGEPPYVRLGDLVQSGQTIGIIEAMKIMNEIASDRSGAVVEILAVNAQAVEYGSPLLRLALDGDDDE
jgi:acetyl-CoA carboxylase biotin carboxyl carrier protein